MKDQIIVSIGREYGSAGLEIAKELSKKLEIPLYDRKLLDELAHPREVDSNHYEKFDEKPRKFLFSRTVKGHSNSPEDNLAELQFALIKSKAADGDSFVIVGRCSDHILKDYPGLISIFIRSDDMSNKIKYIMRTYNLNEKKAKKAIECNDKKRSKYYKYYTGGKIWGVSKNYDLCINSSALGIQGTIDLLYDFIQQFKNAD